MAIFNSYVKLPEGRRNLGGWDSSDMIRELCFFSTGFLPEHYTGDSFHGIYPLVMTNIAMGNGPFIDGLPINSMVIFHGYVK